MQLGRLELGKICFLFPTSSVSKSSPVENIINISESLHETQHAWKCYVGGVSIFFLDIFVKYPNLFLSKHVAKLLQQ